MNKYLSSLTAFIPFGVLCVLAGIFSFTANADSTITIPVPKDYPDRKVTLSLKIPAKTEPLTRKEQKQPAIASNRIYFWDPNPSPKLDNDDEMVSILTYFLKKGWISNSVSQTTIKRRPIDKYYAVLALDDICNNIIKVGKAKNFNNVIKKINITYSDIEDLRRMLKRFEKDIVLFGANPTKKDKDLLVIQERLKKVNTEKGILKVIKVEGTEDGATIIHMTVD